MLRRTVQIVITRPAKISPAWLPILTVSSIFHESQTRLPNVLSSYFEPSILLTLPVYQQVRLPCQMAGILAFMVNGEHKTQKGEQICSRLYHKWGGEQGTPFESRFSPHQTVLSIFPALTALVSHCMSQAAGHSHPQRLPYSSILAFPGPGMNQPQLF